jgi:hypothetical protein
MPASDIARFAAPRAGEGGSAHDMIRPPSTLIVWPVM